MMRKFRLLSHQFGAFAKKNEKSCTLCGGVERRIK